MADMFHLADNTIFGPWNVFLFIFGIIFQCIKIDGTNQLQSPAFIENVKYLVILGSWVCLVTQSCPSLCNPTDSRQEYWSGLPFPPPGDLPNSGIKIGLLHCRWTLCPLSHQGSPILGLPTQMATIRLKMELFFSAEVLKFGMVFTFIIFTAMKTQWIQFILPQKIVHQYCYFS